ncbi:MAG: cell division protein FtsA [Hyphomicrobiaceae bacterium]
MMQLRGRHKHSSRRGGIIGLLDIGTSKVAAAVVASGEPNGPRVLGVGLQRSRGVKAGVLTDLDQAEAAVRAAIAQAERAAGVTLQSVIVSTAAGRIKSQHFAARTDVLSGRVGNDDLARVHRAARDYAMRDGRSLLHINELTYRLDGLPSGYEPRGLAARHLAADFHAITADEGPLRNLHCLIANCHLECDGIVAAPYASALAVTSQEERELGVTVIDIGAGTACVALFAEGHFVGADVVPVGSYHITTDIGRTLQTPLSEAERIKTLYGTLVSAQSDEHETFSYSLAGEEDGATYQTTKARLTEIIRPRFAHILGLLRERLAANPASPYAGDKVVLTGGACQLLGSAEFAANELGRPVRLGKPAELAGLPSSVVGPHFSTLCGLAAAAEAANGSLFGAGESAPGGYFREIGDWLAESF